MYRKYILCTHKMLHIYISFFCWFTDSVNSFSHWFPSFQSLCGCIRFSVCLHSHEAVQIMWTAIFRKNIFSCGNYISDRSNTNKILTIANIRNFPKHFQDLLLCENQQSQAVHILNCWIINWKLFYQFHSDNINSYFCLLVHPTMSRFQTTSNSKSQIILIHPFLKSTQVSYDLFCCCVYAQQCAINAAFSPVNK